MIADKMCVGVTKDKLMLRVMDEHYEPSLKKKFVYPMDFNGRTMKGFLFIEEGAYTNEKDLDHWIDLGLEFGKLGTVKSKKK
jgi:hypothetical protein